MGAGGRSVAADVPSLWLGAACAGRASSLSGVEVQVLGSGSCSGAGGVGAGGAGAAAAGGGADALGGGTA
jgi:hypothetical protein